MAALDRASCRREHLRADLARDLYCGQSDTASGCVDQYALAALQACEMDERVERGDERGRNGRALLDGQRWRSTRDDRGWRGRVRAERARGDPHDLVA